MVYLKDKEILIVSSLDLKKKSVIKIDGKIKKIFIPKEVGKDILEMKHMRYLQDFIDENTSIVLT